MTMTYLYVVSYISDVRPLICPATVDLISDSEYGIPDEGFTASSGIKKMIIVNGFGYFAIDFELFPLNSPYLLVFL